jgi:hypothetical protein
MLAHIILLELLEKRNDVVFVSWLRWEFDLLFGESVGIDDAEVFVVRNVEEVDILL